MSYPLDLSKGRKLAYDFLSLPHHVQMGVIRGLNLTLPMPENTDDVEFTIDAFQQAAKEGKIEILREAVEQKILELEQEGHRERR